MINYFLQQLLQAKWFWKYCTVFLIVLDLIAYGFKLLVEKLNILYISDYYQIIMSICPDVENIVLRFRPWFLVLTCISFIIWIYKKSFYLVSLKSFSRDLADVDIDNIKEKYRVILVNIDISDAINNQSLNYAITKFDKECEAAIKNRNNSPAGFYGIAHTPFIFRLGYRFGNQSNYKLYHKARSNDSVFKEWTDQKGSFKITEKREINADIVSDELIVAVSTTFEIKESQIVDLNPDNKHIIMLYGNNLNFDAITSYVDAQNARETIMDEVRNLVKKYDIQRIHMAIASSAAFTFFLGMAYSKQHDPECIVYHYEMPHYPWGLSIKMPTECCFVDNTVGVQE